MLFQIFFLIFLIILSIYDIKTRRIPNKLIGLFSIIILLVDFFTAPLTIPLKLLKAFLFFLIFYIVSIYTQGLGMGDVKLATLIGYYSGIIHTSIIFITGSVLGILFYIVLCIYKRKDNKIPYAPFVTIGYFISEIVCRRLW